MSQFIANLNTDTPPTDDLFSAHDDLSLFAQTDFFDFDMGEQLNNLPGDFQANTTSNKKSSTANYSTTGGLNILDGKSLSTVTIVSICSSVNLSYTQSFSLLLRHFQWLSRDCLSVLRTMYHESAPRAPSYTASSAYANIAPRYHNRSHHDPSLSPLVLLQGIRSASPCTCTFVQDRLCAQVGPHVSYLQINPTFPARHMRG